MRMSSGTIPRYSSSSISSSPSSRRYQSRHTPTVVDDYAPLELPLRCRDPPSEYPPLELPLRWRNPPPPQITSPPQIKSNPSVPLPLQHSNNDSAPDDELDSVPGDKRGSAPGIQSSSVARDFASDSSSLIITDEATAGPDVAQVIGTLTEPYSIPLDSEMRDPTITAAAPSPPTAADQALADQAPAHPAADTIPPLAPFAVKNLTAECFHADGATDFYSPWPTVSQLPRLCSPDPARLVFAGGTFYCMSCAPFAVQSYDVVSNDWSKIQATVRRFLRSPSLALRGGGSPPSVLSIAALEKNKLSIPRSVRVWSLHPCSKAWTETERMLPEIYRQFSEAEGGRGFECVDHGDILAITIKGSTNIILNFALVPTVRAELQPDADSGSHAEFPGGSNGAVTTPLFPGFPDTFNFLSLEQISVAGQAGVVNVKPTASTNEKKDNLDKCIIDSGTTLTPIEGEGPVKLEKTAEINIRKNQTKKVVYIPAAAATFGRPSGEVCHGFLALRIAEMNTYDVEICGKAASVKISGLNLIDKATVMQCPQAVRRNVNDGFDIKCAGLGDKSVDTSIIVMIQANIAKENAEDDGARNTLINMLFGGLKVWSGNPIMFSRYDTSISDITADRTMEEGRHASNFFFALSACNTMVPFVVQKLIDYQGKSLDELTLVHAAVADSLVKEVGINIENKIFDPGGLLSPFRQRVSTESSPF